MSSRKRKKKRPSKDPWDAQVKGTDDQGDGDNETVRIPLEVIEEVAEEADVGAEAPAMEDPERERADKSPDPRDLRISVLETRLEETERLLEQTRAAYRKREKELEAARERLERDRDKHLERSRVALLERLFEPMDNLDRSLSSAGDWADKDERTEGLLGGLAMVRRQLHERLDELGLVRFDPEGEPFDPNLHEAMSAVPVKDKSMDGKVVEVWEPGYRCGEVVLRAARVVVGRRAAAD